MSSIALIPVVAVNQNLINEIMDCIYIANECGESVRHILYEHFSMNQDVLTYLDACFEFEI